VVILVRIIAAPLVHITIGRVKMEEVAIHGRGIVEPAFGERMLSVVTISLFRVATTLVPTKTIFISRGTTRHVGIHIPYFAIGLFVGALEMVPQGAVALHLVVFYNVMQSCF
jgi:hypothetical protein